ncbi:MAG: DUF1697 domain-containing protein [Sporichthyaceae bacterium]
MAVHVALLRGINVGKNNRVPMATLRSLLEDLGYTDVRTHLNSGNAVFTVSGRQQPATVAKKVEAALLDETGLTLRVVVRSQKELADVVAKNPFADVATDPARFLVAFLAEPVPAGRLRAVDVDALAPEQFHVARRELYLWLPSGIQNSPMMKVLTDQKLGVATTARNWNTVTKLLELAG